ncbi:hypothetical protein BBJ28_00027112 [Nothophytophthora sp. Chile5]|nr:hypothetical protein BBJ28_00027112 [Nothophytophthora sp. Chile5]
MIIFLKNTEALNAEANLTTEERACAQIELKEVNDTEIAAKEKELTAKDKAVVAKENSIISSKVVIAATEKTLAAVEATMTQRERDAELKELLNEKRHRYLRLREQDTVVEFERLRVGSDKAGVSYPG